MFFFVKILIVLLFNPTLFVTHGNPSVNIRNTEKTKLALNFGFVKNNYFKN